MKKLLCIGLLLLISNVFAAMKFNPKTFKYKTGQIIAISETNYDPTTFFFEAFTGSRFGHIGIVVVEDGEVMVYEGNPPYAQKNTINDFLARSVNDEGEYQATVLGVYPRLKYAQRKKLVATVKEFVDKKVPYNFGQTMTEGALNCSEFVHAAFKSVYRTTIGEPQTINELNRNSFSGELLNYWEMLTGAHVDESAKYLSPASIVFSKNTLVIASNLPYDKILSDKEVLKAWSSETPLYLLDDQLLGLGSGEAVKGMLESLASDKPYTTLEKRNYRRLGLRNLYRLLLIYKSQK